MLSRFSDVLQSAADVLAPPPTRFEDFEYHWKLILHFYQNYDESSKVHVEETRVPHHLNQMLQLIVDEESEQHGGTVGPCLEAIVQRSVCLLDGLAALAAADRPPGARALALATGTALLRRTRQPCVNSAHVYRPLQRMLVQCSESPASPTEKEEVELLLTLCGLVRKEPGLANIFTTPYVDDRETLLSIPEDIQKLIKVKPKSQTPKKNPLFLELPANPLNTVSIVRTSSSESEASDRTVLETEKFLLIDLLLSYLGSADNQVVLRACEGIMIVSSLPDDGIANLVTSGSSVCECLIEKLCDKFGAIPSSVDPCDVDHLSTTWGCVHDFADKQMSRFHGYRELTAFFSWLDYCDTLMKECHPSIASHLARAFRQQFLEGAASAGLLGPCRAALATALLAKCLRAVDSPEFINEFTNWLVGESETSEWPVLLALIDNCLTERHELTLETLRFFEAMIEKPTEHSIQRLVLSRVCTRGYYSHSHSHAAPLDDDERDRLNDVSLWQERERNREAMKQLRHEEQVQSQISGILRHEGLPRLPPASALHQVVNSFLLLLPKAVLSDPVGADYEQYIHDASRHYQIWLDMTSSFSWPSEPQWLDASGSQHSCDSRPEVDIHLDEVFEKKTESQVNDMKNNDFDDANERNNVDLNRTEHAKYSESNVKNEVFERTNGNTTGHESHFDSEQDIYDKATESLQRTKITSALDDVFAKTQSHFEELFESKPSFKPERTIENIQTKEIKSMKNKEEIQRLVLRSRDQESIPEEDEFDEGPFLRMIFKLLSDMPLQPYQVNLHLTSIVSKLALMPHPNLHEYLLDPMLPTSRKTQTLFKTLQELARKLTVEIPRLKNYKKVIENTRSQLMSEDPAYDVNGDHNQLVESLIVVEEFCKELAAIAFVKYQHSLHCN